MKKKSLLLVFGLCIMSCGKEVNGEGFPEMNSFYIESCGLTSVALDSVKSFSNKVNNYTTDYPKSKEHSLYPKIQDNIKKASFQITIECDTTWDGETHITF